MSASDTAKSNVGIFTTPADVAALVRDLQANPVGEYLGVEGRRDLQLSKAAIVATKGRARGLFASGALSLRQSSFPIGPPRDRGR